MLYTLYCTVAFYKYQRSFIIVSEQAALCPKLFSFRERYFTDAHDAIAAISIKLEIFVDFPALVLNNIIHTFDLKFPFAFRQVKMFQSIFPDKH